EAADETSGEDRPRKRRRRGGRRRGKRKREDEVSVTAESTPPAATRGTDDEPEEEEDAESVGEDSLSRDEKYRSVPTWEEAIGYLVRREQKKSGNGGRSGSGSRRGRRGSGQRRG